MRIVILGAGTVGTSIADLLCRHGHSITVVDTDESKTQRLNERYDVRAVNGSASESTVLFQADVIGADLCLAVTGVDEVNLVAASIAKAMGSRRTMARVFAPVFRDMSTFDYQHHFHIDRLLSLENLAALEFARGIRNPGSLAVETLVRGELEVQEWEVQESTRAVGVPLRELALPRSVRVGCILRDGITWIAGADDIVQAKDRVTVIGKHGDIGDVRGIFQRKRADKKFVVIAGGGETGYHLARILEGDRYRVVVIDIDEKRTEFLANNLKHATVVRADATAKDILEEERVGLADVFVACMADDEENILACVEAREVGAKSVMSIVSRPDYSSVVHKLGIAIAVSPREVMAKQVLSFLNEGPVISKTRLADSTVGVLEIEVREGASATEHVLANLKLPPKCLIAAVTREEYVNVPGADDRLKPGDTVISLVDESSLNGFISLFQTNAT